MVIYIVDTISIYTARGTLSSPCIFNLYLLCTSIFCMYPDLTLVIGNQPKNKRETERALKFIFVLASCQQLLTSQVCISQKSKLNIHTK